MSQIEGYGERVKNDLNAYIAADQMIRPLRDQIVLEPLPWRPSAIIDVASDRKVRGKVLAVGPGTNAKKYDGPKGKRTKYTYSKHFTPLSVKVGDTVELGGLEIGEYLHQTFMWGTRQVIICQENDVAFIHESS
jgi:co-chaperonin GroES (HSP10)